MKKKNDNDKHSYIFTRETLGMTLLLFCALMLIILLTYNTVFSSLGAAVCAFMYGTFGYGSYLVVAALADLGVWLVFEKSVKIRLRTLGVVALTLLFFFMLFQAVTTRDFALDSYGGYLSQCYSSAEAGYAGYTFGGALSGLIVYPVARGTTFIGAYVIFSIAFLLCAYLCFIVVRGEIASSAGRSATKKAVRSENRVEGESIQPAVNDNAYTVDENYEIVNNFHPVPPVQDYAVQNYPAPAQGYQQSDRPSDIQQTTGYVEPVYNDAHDEDKFSQRNLGRKILFENGEFAAESYRRNMIFNDDSYFNHPVHNEGDYLSSFTSGNKPSRFSGATAGQQNAQQQDDNQSGSYRQSYSQSYSRDVENSNRAPSTPSYIYGDKPVENLGDCAPAQSNTDEEYYDNDDYRDDYSGFTEGGHISEEPSYEEKDDGIFSRREQRADSMTSATGSMPSEDDRFSDARMDETLRGDDVMRRTDENTTDEGGNIESPARTDFFSSDERRNTFGDGARDIPLEKEEEEDSSDILRRNGQSLGDERRESRSNDIRSIFSASNSNISDEVKPDSSRISSRRGESRENLFDGDDDDYLTDDIPDLGTRGLRSDTEESVDRGARRSEISPVQDIKNNVAPVRATREEQSQPAAEPEKPKHVWKKYVRPTLDLLSDYPENNNANLGEIEESKAVIIDTFENAHIAAHISDVTVGPAITRYDVIIEDRTNIKSAMRCRDAIAMSLMKENVGTYLNYSKGAISIEVPNSKRTTVGLKGMLTSSEFINCKSNTLTFALGKDVEGKPICPDITKMPHLLVAGTTGSGKSICLSSLIISLLYKYGPDELRFILVDPKQSEFISYENLPHLIVNEIISDVDKAIKALNWAIKEMERRYALFKEMTLAGTLVKNINEYNANLPDGEEKLPKIVIILDEFGDLMLQNKKDIESRIIRLVQKSRACGIHLILATQRPSVDCITGLIKSNLPTRIGFKVNSFDDSRTIFDIGGAEKLLGAGDMYFRSATNPDLARIQGCFISSPEVQAVTDFVKKNNESYFDQSVTDFINTVEEPGDDGGSDSDGNEGDVKIDDKFIQALKFCVTSNQASVSMLQRRFPIGYVKACKIIDWMENMNYITQSEGSKPRKVLLSLDEFTRIYGDVDD